MIDQMIDDSENGVVVLDYVTLSFIRDRVDDMNEK